MYKICHTEASSRRQRELEALLLEMMNRQPYEKITLTELCLEYQIPRKTFYRYFPTKEDCLLALIDHTLADCNTVALRGWNGSTSLDACALLQFFRYWLDHKAFLNAIRDNGLQHLLLNRTTVIVDWMKENNSFHQFARDQVEYFIAHGLMMTVLRWHQFEFPENPEKMAAVFGNLLGATDASIARLLL